MMGADLQQVENHPYLGVELTSNLDWGLHIKNIAGKAQRSLNFLQRNLYKCPEQIKQQAYFSIVRPVLEYSGTIWDPHYQKHISTLEAVQRNAARFVKRNYQRTASVTQMLQELKWPSLQDRRTISRLTMLHKINSGDSPLTVPGKFQPVNTDRPVTRSHRPDQFINYPARTELYKNSFYPRTIRQWNLLPASVITQSTSAKSFNTNAWKYMNDHKAQLYMGRPAGRSTSASI
ncbi:uncharacterized protein [Amphiura filiformis]|uniref:uncharacterized protein n=1 Tax=Amphiura filiformis TaxID=82378 RepID=UPI003B219875